VDIELYIIRWWFLCFLIYDQFEVITHEISDLWWVEGFKLISFTCLSIKMTKYEGWLIFIFVESLISNARPYHLYGCPTSLAKQRGETRWCSVYTHVTLFDQHTRTLTSVNYQLHSCGHLINPDSFLFFNFLRFLYVGQNIFVSIIPTQISATYSMSLRTHYSTKLAQIYQRCSKVWWLKIPISIGALRVLRFCKIPPVSVLPT
jgi:hypothetical protein